MTNKHEKDVSKQNIDVYGVYNKLLNTYSYVAHNKRKDGKLPKCNLLHYNTPMCIHNVRTWKWQLKCSHIITQTDTFTLSPF